MNAKKSKLVQQFKQGTEKSEKISDIFQGVAIFVNGYTRPTSEELKHLMSIHGGVYHTYQMSRGTTHIIASNLPTVKVRLKRK